MLKRFGASSKHRKEAGALKSSAIIVTGGQPETNEEDPASIIEHNKVPPVCTEVLGVAFVYPEDTIGEIEVCRCVGLFFQGWGYRVGVPALVCSLGNSLYYRFGMPCVSTCLETSDGAQSFIFPSRN